ncbi:hypothetical protein DYQ86_25450 [Acidobacteria bacterium AB60]|nr:hypothetical protein DYQ86_25450 [Acidobacteria bacterium AB60]
MSVSREMSGWRGVALVAATYVYFLIFAQFGFLARLVQLNLQTESLTVVMGAMAAGGIFLSLSAPRIVWVPSRIHRLRLGLLACAAAALVSLLPLQRGGAIAVAFVIGAGLGLLTVTLVTDLPTWTGTHHPILKVGLGTGIGYFVCNVPALFTATPQIQAITAAAVCLAGAAMVSGTDDEISLPTGRGPARLLFVGALLSFAALVWLDSAAFFIIQHTPELKAGTWMGSLHLWMNAFTHLAAALAAGWLLERRRAPTVLAAAFIALGFACLLLRDPVLSLPASLFYPVGVSLYSVALVAYPSFLTAATTDRERARQAGWIYAIAGWISSALGIGMGQNLGHVPAGFVAVAGIVVLLPALAPLVRSRAREVAFLAVALGAAFLLERVPQASNSSREQSSVKRGREVYISEGCIHCHSQYVRPNSPDVLLWGPVKPLQEIRAQQPPLIGNRRQGPDLAEVGGRRSALWLKAHLVDPGQVSAGSIMPSYAFLFRDERGDDLVAYLASLQSADLRQQRALQQAWEPAPTAQHDADVAEGAHLYLQFCATCHDAAGATRSQYRSQFRQKPADLFVGPFKYVRPGAASDRRSQLSRIVKFGILDTDMPGHEYLSDRQIASLALYLTSPNISSVHQ